MLGFYVPPTAMVTRRRDLALKSHPKVRRTTGLNSRPLVYKASSLTTEASEILVFGTELIHSYFLAKISALSNMRIFLMTAGCVFTRLNQNILAHQIEYSSFSTRLNKAYLVSYF